MNILYIANYLTFICCWTICFTTFFLGYTKILITHLTICSVHFVCFQFTFTLKISLQVQKMWFRFHRAFALGAVHGLFTFWFTVHSQCAIFLALSCSAHWPVPIVIKENNQFWQNFHPLVLHSYELWLNVTPTSCFLWNVLWLDTLFASLLGVWFNCWLFTCLWRLNCNNSFVIKSKIQRKWKRTITYFSLAVEKKAPAHMGLGSPSPSYWTWGTDHS